MGNWSLNGANKEDYEAIKEELREEFEDERASLLAYICARYNIPLVDMNNTVEEWEDRYLEEKKDL